MMLHAPLKSYRSYQLQLLVHAHEALLKQQVKSNGGTS